MFVAALLIGNVSLSYFPKPLSLSHSSSSSSLTNNNNNHLLEKNLSHLPSKLRTGQEEEANIAYFLQIAESTIPLLPRLLNVLYHERNVYAIHFDLKIASETRNEAIRKIKSSKLYKNATSNIIIMPSELITYRGISMLLNTISAMNILLQHDIQWDYFINLSGADYPLLQPSSIRSLLGQYKHMNFFSFADRVSWKSMAENRLSQLWFDDSLSFKEFGNDKSKEHLVAMANARNPFIDRHNLDICHAEAWMINSKAFCEFVLHSDFARKLLVAFSYAVDSSEHYFATLAWNNASFKQTIVPHSMRKIVWTYNGVMAGQHPYLIDELVVHEGGTGSKDKATLKEYEDGEGEKKNAEEKTEVYKFKADVSESVLLFTRKVSQPDSALMDWMDERGRRDVTISKAREHFISKVGGRQERLSRLWYVVVVVLWLLFVYSSYYHN